MVIIRCYALMIDSEVDDNYIFYKRLSTIAQEFNTKIGSDNRGYNKFMRKQTLGYMNYIGERFAVLYAISNLIVG
ncbi:hypothetical protein DPMN_097637 [Dreissena polymorpha]|uniref:Uncharacterized protein n=1 Tax=Dreissena polymorpha TaxID=45954 RepID=A0A9D4R5X0_DREPO|nr:hypothetical protein DPMN_097637 [Dreissena polymorpha]